MALLAGEIAKVAEFFSFGINVIQVPFCTPAPALVQNAECSPIQSPRASCTESAHCSFPALDQCFAPVPGCHYIFRR